MALTTAVTITAAMLAVGAGIAKLLQPQPAVIAMRSFALPSSAAVVRVGSVAECGIGVAALVSASWIPRALLAASYVALAAFVSASMRSGSAVPCGCFGERRATISRRHLALNVACAAGVAATVLAREGAPLASIHAASLDGALTLLVGAVSALLAATYASHGRTA